MFDFVREKKRLVQIVLLLIILPFAFWGVDSYRKTGGGESLATVNGEKISPQEFDNALRQQQDRLRESMGEKFDPAMLDKPETQTQSFRLEEAFNTRPRVYYLGAPPPSAEARQIQTVKARE